MFLQPGEGGSLNPVACAMALLPARGGRRLAPLGWVHLMDPGSPIADLYHICHECEAFLAQQRALQKKLRKVWPWVITSSQALSQRVEPVRKKKNHNSTFVEGFILYCWISRVLALAGVEILADGGVNGSLSPPFP